MSRSLRGRRRFRRNGMAMIIILGAIVLITLIVVGFVGRTGSESQSMANYHAVASVRQLTDTVVNLVEAQINDATMQAGGTAWASQPGAVRVFTKTGALQTVYKLYSSDTLTTSTASDLANDMPSPTWSDSPALWVDLNAPATTEDTGTSRKVFPILDPRNPKDQTQLLTTLDGFSLDNPPVSSGAGNPSDPHYQPAPMPVRWLYVLQNGELIAPDAGGSGRTASFGNAATKPSAANPIVGRVAFWTDDDTCKININTAGDGTFWDTPHFNTVDEQNRAWYQPAKGEFQSYPGHPATTSLHAVLTALGASFGTYPVAAQGSQSEFFKILPRYDDDYGSKLGTAMPTIAATAKSDRLYSSVGELLFDKNRNPGGAAPDGLTREQLETGKFFLTAHSRAPEVNLFGMPRIAIWPIPDTTAARTPIDTLIAFCSTVNLQPYYFTRSNPASPTADALLKRNTTLLQYLDALTQKGIPGVTTSTFDGKYSQLEKRQILTEIFDYIRTINLRQPPLGGKTYPQYAQLPNPVTQVYPPEDAATAGKADAQAQVTPTILNAAPLAWNTQGFGRFPVISEFTLLFTGAGRGPNSLVPGDTGIPVDANQPSIGTPPPALANDTTAVQTFLVFELFNPTYGFVGMELSLTVVVKGLDGLTLNGTSLNMPSSATLGVPSTGIGGFTDANGHAAVIDPRFYLYKRKLGTTVDGNSFPFYSAILAVPGLATQTPRATMTLQSAKTITVELHTGPGPVGVTPANTAAAPLIQTYTLDLTGKSIVLPVPTALPHPAPSAASSPWLFCSTAGMNAATPSAERLNYVTSSWFNKIFNGDSDTMISLVPSPKYSDYRLFAAGTVPAGAFTLHPMVPLLATATQNIAVNLRSTRGPEIPQGAGLNRSTGGANGGNVVPNSTLPRGSLGEGSGNVKLWNPCITPTVTTGVFISSAPGAFTATPGDWDNAMSDEPYAAGPFLNKADEGVTYSSGATTAPYYGSVQNALAEKGVSAVYFSPNREISSPVMFGSLPTGVKRGLGWQTLLFRPGPAGHPGSVDPKDHYLLDFFWMPVVEPYAISEPFSTAGKVNLNYQIVPFTYITRNTALRAVLASEKVAQVPKTVAGSTPGRYALNLSETNGTLRQFFTKFKGWDIFRSATEICDIYLVPSTETWTDDATAQGSWYGADFLRVGDNVRERPYSSIYTRVTTKSNTFTAYYITQALKIPTTGNPAQWNEDQGVILGTYRGSTTLERYLDPNDSTIPEYATNPAETKTLEQFYRWRVVENTQFAP